MQRHLWTKVQTTLGQKLSTEDFLRKNDTISKNNDKTIEYILHFAVFQTEILLSI